MHKRGLTNPRFFLTTDWRGFWTDGCGDVKHKIYLASPLFDKGGVGGGNFEFKNHPLSISPSFEGERKGESLDSFV